MRETTAKKGELNKFLTTVRSACSSKHWSQAVELNRRSEFFSEKHENDAVSFRVSESGKALSHKVSLWLSDEDWNCDCNGKDDPCLHVLAVAIELKKTGVDQISSIKAKPVPKISYRFTRKTGFLYFERMIIDEDGKSFRLSTSITSLASGRVPGPKVVPGKEDLAVDILLKGFQNGLVPPSLMPNLIKELQVCQNITLDGEPVLCKGLRTGFIARVEDVSGGVRLFGLQDPNIHETFRNGAALMKDGSLRPFGHGKLSPEEIKMLAEGHRFGLREIPELVSRLLPQLEQKLGIEIQSRKLPQQIKVPPRLLVETKADGARLQVIPLIVYGDPVVAKIISGEMEILGDQIPIRDEKEEKRLQTLLQSEHTLSVGETKAFSGTEAFFFMQKLFNAHVDLCGNGVAKFSLHTPLDAKLNVSTVGDQIRFDMHFHTSQGGKVDSLRVLEAWKNGEQLVPLLDGGWSALPTDWLNRYGDTLHDLLSAKSETGELHYCMARDLLTLCEGVEKDVPQALIELQESLEDFSGIPQVEIPSDLQTSLRKYQLEGVSWLTFMKKWGLGALLADDMGLGKTLQAICVLAKPSLVVAPTSVIFNWEREINRFRPSLKVCVYHGPKRTIDNDADVVVTTYSLLRMDEVLLSRFWDLAILDEAQNIKNPESQVAHAAYALKARSRITLSGTPLENRLEDLWSQFHYLNRGLLGSKREFINHYVRPMSQGDGDIAARLQKRLKPFILRRLKSKVAAELPMRTDTILYCELDEDERNVYESLLAATRSEVLQKLNQGKDMLQVLELLLRLRQASCHRGLVPGQVAETSSKVERLFSCLRECVDEGNKALVFSQWTGFLDLIGNALAKEGISFDRIDGSTKNRKAIVDQFQNQNDHQVLLLSLKAAGTGLNLTAADHVFIVDPWWNPSVEAQAADRAHRIGQTKPVMVYRLVAKDTVEEKILLLQEKKKALAEAVVSSGAKALQITKEDLLSLFA